MSRQVLKARVERLRREIDYHERRFRDLGQWDDSMRANALRNELWDTEEQLRQMEAP